MGSVSHGFEGGVEMERCLVVFLKYMSYYSYCDFEKTFKFQTPLLSSLLLTSIIFVKKVCGWQNIIMIVGSFRGSVRGCVQTSEDLPLLWCSPSLESTEISGRFRVVGEDK